MEREGYQLWVGNVPYNATAAELHDFFAVISPEVRVELKTDAATGHSRGFGFCHFPDAETCALAVAELQGALFKARPLRLEFAVPDQGLADLVAEYHALAGRQAAGPAWSAATNDRRGGLGAASEPFTDAVSGRVAVASVVSSLSVVQLVHVVGAAQEFLAASPEAAIAAFAQRPALCWALMHAYQVLSLPSDPPAGASAPVPPSERARVYADMARLHATGAGAAGADAAHFGATAPAAAGRATPG